MNTYPFFLSFSPMRYPSFSASMTSLDAGYRIDDRGESGRWMIEGLDSGLQTDDRLYCHLGARDIIGRISDDG